MAPILSALPILLATGALRRPAYQGGYASVLHIARRVKPDVFKMALSKSLSHTPFRSSSMSLFKSTSAGPTKSRPQFVTKGPPLSTNSYWVYLAVGSMLALVEGVLRPEAEDRKRAKLAVEGPSNLGATGKAPNGPSWTVGVFPFCSSILRFHTYFSTVSKGHFRTKTLPLNRPKKTRFWYGLCFLLCSCQGMGF